MRRQTGWILIGLIVVMGAARPGGVTLKKVTEFDLPGPAGKRFDYLTITPDDHHLLSAHLGAGQMYVIDLQTNRVLATVADTPGAEGVEYVPELKKAYTSNAGDNTIGVVDLRQMKVIKKIRTEAKPDGSAYAEPFHKLYVSDERGKAEAIVDVRTDTIVKTLRFESETGMPQYDRVAKKIYVNLQDQNIFAVIDPATDEVVGRYPVGRCEGNHGMTLDPEHHRAFLSCEGNDLMTVFNLDTHQPIAFLPMAGGPDVIKFDAGLKRIYAACYSGAISVFQMDDPDHYRKLEDFPVQKKVHSLAVDPETHRVYAPEQEADGKAVARMAVYEAPVSQSAENDAVKIEARYKNETDQYDKAFEDFEKRAGLDEPFRYDLSGLEQFLRSQMMVGNDGEARQTAAVLLVTLAGYQVALPSLVYKQVLQVVPAEAATWGKEGEVVEYESEGLDPADAKKLLQEIADHNPDRHLQARAQAALVKLASRQHDPKAYEVAYAKLEQYKDLKDTKFEIFMLNPQNKIAPGKPAPDFHLPAIDGAGEISNQSLPGKWYLLDFWATWCGPCMGERPALQEAYGKFKDKGFTIVSISLDETPDKVVIFRKNRWSMPWQHAFLPGGQSSQTAKDYEVDRIGLPRLVLVGPDGKVAAVQYDLSREVIDRTLNYFLASAPGPR